jgi:hypothetical protein
VIGLREARWLHALYFFRPSVKGEDVKKLYRRKALTGFLFLGIILIFSGGSLLFDGLTHHGKGIVRIVGGDSNYEHTETVPESKYRRDHYTNAFILFLLAGTILFEFSVRWKKQDNLDKIEDIQKHTLEDAQRN